MLQLFLLIVVTFLKRKSLFHSRSVRQVIFEVDNRSDHSAGNLKTSVQLDFETSVLQRVRL